MSLFTAWLDEVAPALLPGIHAPSNLIGAAVSTMVFLRKLRSWEENTPGENLFLSVTSVFLVLFAGMMSGLTLGLCSIDKTQLEVLKRSGTAREQKCARKVSPLLENTHFLLVTLLLCNACAMEALPLFLDRLANPVTAIIVSVTAVLFFGEIIPQSVCSRYGLSIGARLSWLVRLLMFLCSPIAWPLGKFLDWLLGAEHHSMFRRKQLKALVDIHGEDKGLGGKLSKDETKIITGALDLTSKRAFIAMTPLEHVFMLSTADKLDEPTLRSILNSGHSRIPVYRNGLRHDIVGIILVKELLQYKMSEAVPVAMLKMRSLPRLPETTPLYDMLKLFQTGRSHMAVLTRAPGAPPPYAAPGTSNGGEPPTTPGGGRRVDLDEFGEDEDEDSDLEVGREGQGHPHHRRPHFQYNQDGTAEPVGIITIEDVIEELIRSEIVDETDIFVDNEHSVKVNQTVLAQTLPERLRAVLATDQRLAAVLGAARAGGSSTDISRMARVATGADLLRVTEEGVDLRVPLLPASHGGRS